MKICTVSKRLAFTARHGLCLYLLLFLSAAPLIAEIIKAPAVVRATAQATISAVVPGVIINLPFDEGDAFDAGDTLIALNCDILNATADAARAEHTAADARFRANRALSERGGIGQTQVVVAQAEAEAAAARATAAELRVQGCRIEAPYDGFVTERVVNRYEYVQTAQAVLGIVSAEQPDIEILAPSYLPLWITPGASAELSLEANGETYAISVTGIAAIVDPVSRTIKMQADFDDDGPSVRPGMSGQVHFDIPR